MFSAILLIERLRHFVDASRLFWLNSCACIVVVCIYIVGASDVLLKSLNVYNDKLSLRECWTWMDYNYKVSSLII